MQFSIGEILDRLSICQLKAQRTDLDCSKELDLLWEALSIVDVGNSSSQYLGFLKIVNGAIWDLESDLRRGKEGELGLEEVGRRAIKIRDLNSIRVFLKNEVNQKFNSGFQEIKKDHASA